MRHVAFAVRVVFVTTCFAALLQCQRDQPDGSDRPINAIRALIITGANNHDWEWTSPELQRLLEATGRFSVDVTRDPKATLADAEALRDYQVFVLDYNHSERWGEPAESNFLAAVREGVGVSVIHAANNAFPGWVEYEKLVALCWRKGTGHGQFHAFDVWVIDRDHPITAGMADMIRHPDELYHQLVHMHDAEYRLLAAAMSSQERGGTGNVEPMVLVRDYGKGRVFHTPLGHVWRNVPGSRASYADPQFRQLVARGTEWAATGEVTLSPAPPNWLTPEEREAGFQLLFDGKTTEGWRGFRKEGFPEKGWVVERGCLKHVANEGGGDVLTVKQFGDFELRFEWAVSERANSGVIYRCDESERTSWRTGPEYQVLDGGENAREGLNSAASLYGLVAPKGVVLKPVGQFNTGRIVVKDGQLEHWLNGVKVLGCEIGGGARWAELVAGSKFSKMPKFGRLERGHIALQDHGNTVWYRSLRIRGSE